VLSEIRAHQENKDKTFDCVPSIVRRIDGDLITIASLFQPHTRFFLTFDMVRTYIPPVDNSRKPLGYGGSYNRSPAKVPPSTSPIPKERGNGRVFLAKKNAANSVIGEDSDSSTSSSDGPFNISLSRKNAVLVSKKWTAKAKSTKLRKKSVLASPKIVKRQTEKRDQKEVRCC